MQNSQNSYYEDRNTRKKFFSSLNSKNKTISTNQNSSFSETSKQQVVSITYEEIGLFPRSFNRVFDRFFKQLFFDVENLVIQEYRFYRYLFLTTVKCLFILIFVPLGINFLAKNYLIRPITEYYWNTHNHEIFLNSYQQKRAFSELKNFEEKIYFESLLFSENQFQKNLISMHQTTNKNDFFTAAATEVGEPVSLSVKAEKVSSIEHTLSQSNNKNLQDVHFFQSSNDLDVSRKNKNSNQLSSNLFLEKSNLNLKKENSFAFLQNQQKNEFNNDLYIAFTNSIQKRLQTKIFDLANHYNEESIEAITNFFADVLSFSSLCFLLVRLEIQINITKSFLLEVFFGLDDSKKSLFILFITDLLVGYHSPNIWELFFQTLFDHYGLPESQTTIFLLVATLPVLLDVLFKYLIFRHLNRASPATVATYHAMIE
uniref:chloroplast envelope membrane protein n=1 Tax=Coelastrella saipanensis TaxID=152631 RepID=UPI0010C506BE|nr:chloroplast envelope membrane protein [Coelastrella saipanensis]AVV61589.1 chloroplast envelope membrane protein [Coelastrella saipanensis]